MNGSNLNSADYQHYYGYSMAQYKDYYNDVQSHEKPQLTSRGVQ